MSATPDIRVSNLSVFYTRRDRTLKHALKDVSLEVYPGEIVSIVGPSGCGKTSILRALLKEGLKGVSYQGECWLNPERAVNLSYLQQRPALLPWRTAMENAALGQEVRGLMTADSIIRVEELLRSFGIADDNMFGYGDELSIGMQQRVTIARALESSPKILLCDEPFSAIDFISRLKMNKIFKQRCSSKVSVLMVTHNIDEAIYLSSRVYVLSGSPGQLVEVVPTTIKGFFGDAVEIRSREEFRETFLQIWRAMGTYEKS